VFLIYDYWHDDDANEDPVGEINVLGDLFSLLLLHLLAAPKIFFFTGRFI